MKMTKVKMDEIEKELSKIVGLNALKLQLERWSKGVLLDESRRALGLEIGARKLPHMAFLGNPGTGKTIVARMLGKLLHKMGLLPTEKVIQVQRTDLVGIGNSTGIQTREKIKEAEGGILFVDEAYRLIPDVHHDHGIEALEEIMSHMDSGKLVVIFAGYSEPMERVISANEGLRRRVTNFFHFEDFTCEELAKILHLKISKQADRDSALYGFKLDSSCSVEAVAAMIERETTENQRKEMNGGLVDLMMVKAKENLDWRTDIGCRDTNSLLTFTSDDLAAGLWLLNPKEKRERSENSCRCSKEEAKAKMEALEIELSKIVGLNVLKQQLHTWLKGMLLDGRRRALGLNVGLRKPPHMAFLGNPGTGKTMVARVIAKLLHMVNILPSDNVVEVQRTDLVAQYIGQTGPMTRQKIKVASGGILFVDEAYRLMPKDSFRDFGREALEEIMSFMDTGNVVVIFAGYSEPMKRVISANEGFKRRVTKFFQFDDYSCEDLATILHMKMSNQAHNSLFYGFKLHPSCTVKAVAAKIKRATTEKQRKEMNGGLVDIVLVNAKENLDSRIDLTCVDTDSMVTITFEDLEAGLASLKAKNKRKASSRKSNVAKNKGLEESNVFKNTRKTSQESNVAKNKGSEENNVVKGSLHSNVSENKRKASEESNVVKNKRKISQGNNVVVLD